MKYLNSIFLLSLSMILHISCEGMSRRPPELPPGVLPLTKSSIQKVLSESPSDETKLNPAKMQGCEVIPFPGVRTGAVNFSGKTCSVTIYEDNQVSVNFANSDRPVEVAPMPYQDIYVGEISGEEVLIVQHHAGSVVNVSYTTYDSSGKVNYGNNDYIKECLLSATLNCGK